MVHSSTKPVFAFFGELILRLSTDGAPLSESRELDLFAGGAEANVAIGLASLGHRTRMLTRIPDNDLGSAALRQLRGAGVDCTHISRGEGRMALYFLTPGFGIRASEIVYDRQDSAFSRSTPSSFDFDSMLEGATHLHLSGITPALGSGPAELALSAARAAKARGLTLVFDGNYRARLWESWDSDPRRTLAELVEMTDIMFGNHRDISLLLGQTFSGSGPERRREAAEAAFRAFPNIRILASTARQVESSTRHRLSARVDSPAEAAETPELHLTDIADRIGAGDAFAAGVLHSLSTSPGDLMAAATNGLALTALKHSLKGDASLFTPRDLEHAIGGGLDVRR